MERRMKRTVQMEEMEAVQRERMTLHMMSEVVSNQEWVVPH